MAFRHPLQPNHRRTQPRWGRQALLLAAAVLLGLGDATAQAPGEAQGSITFHATADGEATDTLDACRFFVQGHGVAGATGSVTFLYAPDGMYQPGQRPLNFTGTANSTDGFDFVVGPFEVPADDGAAADLVYVNVTVGAGYQELTAEPSISCAAHPDSADAPFPSPPALGLAILGSAAALAMIRRWQR